MERNEPARLVGHRRRPPQDALAYAGRAAGGGNFCRSWKRKAFSFIFRLRTFADAPGCPVGDPFRPVENDASGPAATLEALLRPLPQEGRSSPLWRRVRGACGAVSGTEGAFQPETSRDSARAARSPQCGVGAAEERALGMNEPLKRAAFQRESARKKEQRPGGGDGALRRGRRRIRFSVRRRMTIAIERADSARHL